MRTIQYLQSVKTELTELDDLFIIKKRLQELKESYEGSKLKEAPMWVADKLEDVSLEIDLRATGIIKKRLMAAKSRQSALKPKSVKLEEATKEVEELEKLLKE